MTNLGTLLGVAGSGANAINNSGEVVGYFNPSWPGAGMHAFLYSGGILRDLGTLGGDTSEAYGINDSGQVVGYAKMIGYGGDQRPHAFLYSGGTMGDLQAFNNTINAYAYGINNSGQIVGYADTGFLYSGGISIDLDTFAGGFNSEAYGINNSGQVVGNARFGGGYEQAFLYSGGTMSNLGNLGGGDSSATAINNSGQVVGNSSTSSRTTHAFLYISGTMIDLNSLVSTNPGFTLQYAQAINDNLQIVGWGGTHAFLLTPVRNIPPIITLQPHSVTNNAGGNAVFSVSATGTTLVNYQWTLNGTNLAGATSSMLTITNVAQGDLGSYAVAVSDALGTAISSNAVLSMYPNIHVPFSGAVTYWGKDSTFAVQAWGTGPLSYQWFKDGIAILDATNQTLTLLSIQVTNAGFYSVVVSSALGSVTNAPGQVVVEPAGVSLGFCPALTISGVIGYSYIVQSTMDLTKTNSWVTLTNLTLTQPVQLWVDTSVDATRPANSKYFYRVLPGQ